MGEQGDNSVTRLLAEWNAGSDAALGKLTPLLYDELRQLAQRHLQRERPNHTIQRTALVHEAFLRLVNQQSIDWHGRMHFFALASSIMRRILVDHARARLAAKRGGGAVAMSIDEMAGVGGTEDTNFDVPQQSLPHALQTDQESTDDIEAIDAALTRLAAFDARQAQVVEMRYFGGLTIEETAQALDISDATVKREWTLARAWLRRELDGIE